MNAKPEEFILSLQQWAEEYIDVCLDNKKEVVSGSGKVVTVQDRHIPTIDYFLNIWLPRQKGTTICNSTYYNWLRGNDELKLHTIKNIDEKFKALAADIVANEQKGIFYAKNKLGWTDKQMQDINLKQVTANFGSPIIQSTPESGQDT